VIRLVRSRVSGLKFLFVDAVVNIALLAKVKVEAVFTLVPHSHYGDNLTTMALYILSYLLSWLHDELNLVSLRVMASYFCLLGFRVPSEVAVLTHAKMDAVCTHKTSTDDWAHVTANALVVVVGCQSVSKEGKFDAVK